MAFFSILIWNVEIQILKQIAFNSSSLTLSMDLKSFIPSFSEIKEFMDQDQNLWSKDLKHTI